MTLCDELRCTVCGLATFRDEVRHGLCPTCQFAERVSPRVRSRYQERAARAALAPATGNVTVQPSDHKEGPARSNAGAVSHQENAR